MICIYLVFWRTVPCYLSTYRNDCMWLLADTTLPWNLDDRRNFLYIEVSMKNVKWIIFRVLSVQFCVTMLHLCTKCKIITTSFISPSDGLARTSPNDREVITHDALCIMHFVVMFYLWGRRSPVTVERDSFCKVTVTPCITSTWTGHRSSFPQRYSESRGISSVLLTS
jgi:hypothetical protein